MGVGRAVDGAVGRVVGEAERAYVQWSQRLKWDFGGLGVGARVCSKCAKKCVIWGVGVGFWWDFCKSRVRKRCRGERRKKGLIRPPSDAASRDQNMKDSHGR